MKKVSFIVWIWDFVIVLSSLADTCLTAGTYQLTVPAEYTAFSGDLDVHYATPTDVSLPNAFIRLTLITDALPEEITNLGMDVRYRSGSVKVTCGIIEVAGKYEFQLYMYSGGPILTRAAVIVRWPDITLQLPETHMTQSKSVLLNIYSNAACNPRLKRYLFTIDLEYATNKSGISIAGHEEVLHHLSFTNFSASKLTLEFPCSLFDTTGIYRASLKSTFSAISVVSQSNVMTTNLNPAYQIIIHPATIFPCHNILMVNYILAQCPGAKERNKLRIYMLRRKSSGSLASPLERTYIQERHANPDETYIPLSCALFKTTASGYCFQYVTITRDNAIINQTETCRSAHVNSVLPIDGGWGGWTSWSACTATCGSGKQSRYRMCDSPTPDFGGAFCDGESVQRKSCDVFCPESIPLTPLHSPKVDQHCACGCQLDQNEGRIVASGRCDRTSIWLITANDNHYIVLEFKYLNLFLNKQWVKVRNGATLSSDLIAFSDGRNDINHVTSTSNQMLVEFYSDSGGNEEGISHKAAPPGSSFALIYPIVPKKPIHVHGFIAIFTSNETEGSKFPVAAQPIRTSGTPSIWESTVTIVGIVVCGLVVITALSFVIYHRTCHKRQHKYAMAAHEESPKRMCKSTSMPSSPSHESHHGIEIEHDMQVPLTSVVAQSDKKRAKTPGSTKSRTSMSSACSNNMKKLKTKVEIEYNSGNRRASPKTPHRDYCLLPQNSSPRKTSRAHEVAQESEHNMSLFRTSPLLKTKVPRSPKVHPSPKIKKSKTPVTPTNEDSTSSTKHDMLSKRFDATGGRDRHRIVMGSDYTPTTSIKSPPSDSSKADCETPTNINNDVIMRKQNKNKKASVVCENGLSGHCSPLKPGDIKLQNLDKSNEDIDRKPASGTSDDSTSAEKEIGSQMTTSFIENGNKPRRPTSLTESYSKMSLSSSTGADVQKISADCPKDKSSVSSSDDRHSVLPKPDGQSPKSPRIEAVKIHSKTSSPTKTSKNSTPKSIRSLRSDQTDESGKTKSPARSINTPSDVVELEYDDFVDMDDTYSYFDPIETEKLTWHGAEKVKVKTPKTPKD